MDLSQFRLDEPEEETVEDDRPLTYADLEDDDERFHGVFRGRGFKSWIVSCDVRKGGYATEAARPFVEWVCADATRLSQGPVKYSMEDWLKVVRRTVRKEIPAEEKAVRDTLIADIAKSLAFCEAEWRAERFQHDRQAQIMNISRGDMKTNDRHDRLSFRNPQVDDRCQFTSKGGNRCHRYAVPGANKCPRHGGALVDAEVRRAFLLSAYCSVVEASGEAVGVLVDVARNGRNELARVAAAKEILDRAGLSPALNLNVNLGGRESEPLQQLKDRLSRIQNNLRESAPELIDASPSAVIDVESTET